MQVNAIIMLRFSTKQKQFNEKISHDFTHHIHQDFSIKLYFFHFSFCIDKEGNHVRRFLCALLIQTQNNDIWIFR